MSGMTAPGRGRRGSEISSFQSLGTSTAAPVSRPERSRSRPSHRLVPGETALSRYAPRWPAQLEEFIAIAARQVWHRADRALLPEFLVRVGGNVAHWMPPHTTTPPCARRENKGCVERLGRQFVRATSPRRAEATSKFLRLGIPGPREHEDFAAFGPRHLHRDMGGCAESIKPEPLCVACLAKSAIADQSGAEQWRTRYIAKPARKSKTKPGVGHRELRIASVDRIAGEAGVIAKIFPTRQAIYTFAARPSEPGNADPLAVLEVPGAFAGSLDLACNFVAGNQRQLGLSKLAVHHVQIGPSHSASAHFDEHLAPDRPGTSCRSSGCPTLWKTIARMEKTTARSASGRSLPRQNTGTSRRSASTIMDGGAEGKNSL